MKKSCKSKRLLQATITLNMLHMSVLSHEGTFIKSHHKFLWDILLSNIFTIATTGVTIDDRKFFDLKKTNILSARLRLRAFKSNPFTKTVSSPMKFD